MPRKREMTWQDGTGNRSGRWRKKYKNRVFQAPGGRGKSDQEAYQLAAEAFEEFKKQVDAEQALKPKPHHADYLAALKEWRLALAWAVENGNGELASQSRQKIRELEKRANRSKPSPLSPADSFMERLGIPKQILAAVAARIPQHTPSEQPNALVIDPSKLDMSSMDGTSNRIEREIWKDRLDLQGMKQRNAPDSLEANISSFLTTKHAKVMAGKLTAGRYEPIRIHSCHFRDWLGADFSVVSITSKTLTDYHSELLNAVSSGKLSADYARDRISNVKSFVRWLWRNEAIEELPRVLGPGSNDLQIAKKLTAPEVFTIDEVKKLLEEATERTKLYLLLMLNTGSTQKDISDLLHTEFDINAGTITRKRSKTTQHKRVPTVTYQLWDETLRLLKEERSVGSRTVLVNKDGGPLKFEVTSSDGKLSKTDNIASAYSRLKRRVKIDKPLKYLRKTSASLLKSNNDFRGLEGLFLGHAPATMEERHYTQAPQEILNQAIVWLGSQYGIK